MAGINEDRRRHVVPLWRAFRTTTDRGELASLAPAEKSRFNDEMLTGLVKEWEETPILFVAADLVSAALTLGRFDVARQAAEEILSNPDAPPLARAIAEQYLNQGRRVPANGGLGVGGTEAVSMPLSLQARLQSGVRDARRQLVAYPRNPILWCNLALLYTSLGLQEKAEKAMRTALALAPENRFVLRSASRFYLHSGDRHTAHCLLADATSLHTDPWILAAEIAMASATGRTSRNIKMARKVLEVRRHSPFHLSELASAIGTLESLSGNLKTARPLVTDSLREPAENAIAQAAWLHRNIGGVGLETGQTCSFEANAWFASRIKDWSTSLEETKRWQLDQPFSSRPAAFGSFVASVVLFDYEEGAAFAKQGLLANPDDFSLQNNAAFSLVLSGNTEEAAQLIRRVNQASLSQRDQVALIATRGLIEFRSGNAAAGRILYRQAIELGKSLRDVREHIARIDYALEEIRAGSACAETARKEALDGTVKLADPIYEQLVTRLRIARVGIGV